MSALNVSFKFNQIICRDEGDGWGNAEPYLWTVFFKIDGDSVRIGSDLTLSGTGTIHTTPNSHGNLNTRSVDAGDRVNIPPAIGEWNTTLCPIGFSPPLSQTFDPIGGVIGAVCILMEEDSVSGDGAEAGHEALNQMVGTALRQIISTRSFTNQNISEEDLKEFENEIKGGIKEAIRSQQNFLENFWTFIDKDDTIGTKVFIFRQDDLPQTGLSFSERWKNEGDWEIVGDIIVNPRPVSIYGVKNNGSLVWFKHIDSEGGSNRWENLGREQVIVPPPSEWAGFKSVIGGSEGFLYAIKEDGSLVWYIHIGWERGNLDWGNFGYERVLAPSGAGWADFKTVVSGGEGVFYCIKEDGALVWYRHTGWQLGNNDWANSGYERVLAPSGAGWADFKTVVSGGKGVLYCIKEDGALVWYKHNDWQGGAVSWANSGHETVLAPSGAEWAKFKTVISGGKGVLYCIKEDGALVWYKHNDWQGGTVSWANSGHEMTLSPENTADWSQFVFIPIIYKQPM